jgi:tartrate-resistant acid phosphatase type 5
MLNPGIRNIVLLFLSLININLIFGQKFAVVSDIHGSFPATQSVSNLVKSWSPEFIITCGDNNYASTNDIDTQVGQYYHDFISPYSGAYGLGDSVNSFFSALGNHDVESGGISSYLPYVNLPGNERYYDFVKGYVHFFCINSNVDEPDGVADTSLQAHWLQTQLAGSTSLYNLVYFHHPPYSSGLVHGSTAYMQWPFEHWGATTVLSGHDHIYEHLYVGNLDYFICGTGGGNLYAVNPIAGSHFINNTNHGALLVVANADSLVLKFINTNDSLIDKYNIAPEIPAWVENNGDTEDLMVEVFPNPTPNSISVSFKNNMQPYRLTVANVLGRIVFAGNYINNSSKFDVVSQKIDVSALTRGIYFITLSSQEHAVTRKFIIN